MPEPGEHPDVVPYTLGDLSDVASTAPEVGQSLTWDGTTWRPSVASAQRPLYWVADIADDAAVPNAWTYFGLEPRNDENPLMESTYQPADAYEFAVATISSAIPNPGVTQCVRINRNGLYHFDLRFEVSRGPTDRALSTGWQLIAYMIINDEAYGPAYSYGAVAADRGPVTWSVTPQLRAQYSHVEPLFEGDEVLCNYLLTRSENAGITDTTIGYSGGTIAYLGPIT